MKKIIVMIICMALAIPFAGCTSNTGTGSDPMPPSGSSVEGDSSSVPNQGTGKDTVVEMNAAYKGLSIPSSEEQSAINQGYRMIYPSIGSFDRVLAKEKGLAVGEVGEATSNTVINPDGTGTGNPSIRPIMPNFNEKYFYIQALYRKTLEEYLANKINLKEMDRTVANDPMGYKPRKERPSDAQLAYLYPDGPSFIDYYQEHSMLSLTYIYLRNNIYVERLSDDDLKVFEKYYENGDTEVTDELREIVERTYPDIIAVDSTGKYNTAAYQNSPGREAPNKAVVFSIGVLNEDNAPNGYVDHLWNTLIPQFEKDCKGTLDSTPVVFFVN